MTDQIVTENVADDEVAYLERLSRLGVPEHLHAGFVNYLVHRIPPGHFLTAVLQNDLAEAFARADETSRAGLFQLVKFLHNDVPWTAWGSPIIVQALLDQRARS